MGGAGARAGGGGVPGGVGVARGGGIPINFQRQATSKDRLKVDWTLPVYAPDLAEEAVPVEDGRTSSGRLLVALPRTRAIEAIRAEDRRPLLVMRECKHCKGTDDALLSRRLDNEKTILLTRWFRCVKLPNHVLEQNHPFRSLFEAKHPPHLFLCRYDGSDVVDMDGQQTQSDLWKSMTELIRIEYRGDPQNALKGLMRCLDAYDSIDSREQELRDRYEDALERHGPKSSKVKKLEKKLDKLAAEREIVEAREHEVTDLGLRPLPETAGGGG